MKNYKNWDVQKIKDKLYNAFFGERKPIIIDDNTITTDPSWGNISITKVTGATRLHGSLVESHSYVSLAISRGEVSDKFNTTRHYPEHQLIEVYLTNTQFAELLTTVGVGKGIPCTINAVAEVIEVPYNDNSKNQMENTVERHKRFMTTYSEHLADDIRILKNPKSTKAERERAITSLERFKETFDSDAEFLSDNFKEQLQKASQEVKTELDSFVTNVANAYGLEQLKKDAIKRLPKNDENVMLF